MYHRKCAWYEEYIKDYMWYNILKCYKYYVGIIIGICYHEPKNEYVNSKVYVNDWIFKVYYTWSILGRNYWQSYEVFRYDLEYIENIIRSVIQAHLVDHKE